MLRKLLFQYQDKRQLVIAVVGAFLGMTFLITSIHYLIKVNDFGKGADILGPNTVIVVEWAANAAQYLKNVLAQHAVKYVEIDFSADQNSTLFLIYPKLVGDIFFKWENRHGFHRLPQGKNNE